MSKEQWAQQNNASKSCKYIQVYTYCIHIYTSINFCSKPRKYKVQGTLFLYFIFCILKTENNYPQMFSGQLIKHLRLYASSTQQKEFPILNVKIQILNMKFQAVEVDSNLSISKEAQLSCQTPLLSVIIAPDISMICH